MKVLAVTNLFPNAKEPGRGIFNKQQFVELATLCELKVVAPLPWSPVFVDRVYKDVPQEEIIEGISVYHPRYVVTPKVGRRFYGLFFYLGIKKLLRQILQSFDADVILATWAYPDAYGTSILTEKLGKPLVIRVHGSDINVFVKSPSRRKMIREGMLRANKTIAVSGGLKRIITEMGVPSDKIALIPNGVDKTRFRKLDKAECRQKLQLGAHDKHILFIGNLVDIKGIEYLIEAVSRLKSTAVLHIIGEGELKEKLIKLAADLKVQGKITFHGRVKHDQIPVWMNAADVLTLPSLNEGCPNVLLEATACGLPFVASRVGGIPDIAELSPASLMVDAKNAEQLASAIDKLLNATDIRVDTQAIMSWKENAQKVYEVLKESIGVK